MTLTQTITEELLNYLGEPGGIEQVLQKYSRSKGPLYSALASATVEMRQRISHLQQQIREAEAKSGPLKNEVANMERTRDELQERVLGLEDQLDDCERRLEEASGILSRVDRLARCGFGEEELNRLHELLALIAAESGSMPEESVAQFFETVARYETVVSLGLETKRSETRAAQAKSEADRWGAESQLNEAKSKARTSAIDLTEKLMAQGVKTEDLPQWQRILKTAGTSAESLASSLENYASLEALAKDLQQRSETLQEQVSKLETQTAALTKERDGVYSAVQALREKALKEVKAAGQQISREIKEVGARAQEYIEGIALAGASYGNLRDEAADLRELVGVAKNLRSGNPEDWQSTPRGTVQGLLVGITIWAQAEGRNVDVAPPAAILGRSPIYAYSRMRVCDALIWALSGIFTDEERQALSARP